MEELDVKKTKYFVIAIIILIVLGVILIVHFNNKEMVSGEEDKNKTTETIKDEDIIPVTTTTKKRVSNTSDTKVEEVIKELDVEEVIYKSTIDENNEIVYNYKLTDEISNGDKIISTKLSISDELKINDVIGLYDISLYNDVLVKKSVKDSLITIKIPIKDELVGYDEYKIVYIDEYGKISDEKFDVKVSEDYLEFNTTHLSVFGVIGIKRDVVKPNEDSKEEVIDLSQLSVKLKVNDIEFAIDSDNTLLLSKNDVLKVLVSNIDYEYQVYYSLTGGNDYKLFSEFNLEDIINDSLYNLKIKVVVNDKFVEFDMGNISLYDIVYVNDNKEVEEPVGTIKNEDGKIYTNNDGSDYGYENPDINKDIVIDNGDRLIIEEVVENDSESVNSNSEEINDETNLDKESIKTESESDTTDVKIKINGNIYLVEETDISNLEMTGYLVIDTKDNITFDVNYDTFNPFENLYTITIRSEEFTLNGIKYMYKYEGDNVVIYKVKDTEEENETVSIEDFNSIFNIGENQLIEFEKENELVEEVITK